MLSRNSVQCIVVNLLYWCYCCLRKCDWWMTLQYVTSEHIRIWQINSQNFRVRKIWKTWFLDTGAFSWQNATYTIQFIVTIYINSEKPMLPGRCAPVEFFSWKCGKLSKKWLPALIWSFRTSLFSALSWNKISHMKLQSLKTFKMTKDTFYKQFDFFFSNWQGWLWGFVNLVLWLQSGKLFLESKTFHTRIHLYFNLIWIVGAIGNCIVDSVHLPEK